LSVPPGSSSTAEPTPRSAMLGAVLMYSSSAVPSNRALGAVNGLARTVASIECMFGPVVADSLFAFSITKECFGRELCIRRTTHAGVGRVVPCCEASETYVDVS
jgi:hypothetical protein